MRSQRLTNSFKRAFNWNETKNQSHWFNWLLGSVSAVHHHWLARWRPSADRRKRFWHADSDSPIIVFIFWYLLPITSPYQLLTRKKKNIDFQFFKNALGDTTASLVLDYGAMSIYYLYVSLALLYTVVFQLFCCYSAIENRWGKLSQFIWHVCFGQAENSA